MEEIRKKCTAENFVLRFPLYPVPFLLLRRYYVDHFCCCCSYLPFVFAVPFYTFVLLRLIDVSLLRVCGWVISMTTIVSRLSCVAPNCDTGLASVERARIGKKPSLHRFPADVSRKTEWLRAIPQCITLRDSSRLCSLHFTRDCYRSEKTDQREERGGELHKDLLKLTAVPSIWPNCPSYLSRWPEERRTSLGTSEARHDVVVKRYVDRDEKEARAGLSLNDIVNQVHAIYRISQLSKRTRRLHYFLYL